MPDTLINALPISTLIELEDKTRRSLNELREQRERLERLERDSRAAAIKPLVIRAHDLLCSWNHCDGCSWGYEITDGEHNWQGWAHARWLCHYEQLLLGTGLRPGEGLTPEALSQILDAVYALRSINPRALYYIRHGLVAP